MLKNPTVRILLAVAGTLLLGLVVYNIPFVNEKLAWRVENLRSQLVYFLRPPDEAVFVPGENGSDTTPTLPPPQVWTPTLTPEPSATKAGPTLTPTITSTPLPERVTLPGVKYADQHNRWNYCGPANLVMALKFWGWKGQPGNTMDLRDQVALVVKPGIPDLKKDFIQRGFDDKNVMPYEMENFVNNETEFRALSRFGGDMDLLKRLIAAGFPVVIEKGYVERDAAGKITWMGHYLFVTGYDDGKKAFIVQDAYLRTGKNGTGQDLLSEYDIFQQGWRNFNYLFMVVYPPERETDLFNVLGDWVDLKWANQHALELANQDIKAAEEDMDSFFAWFNKGTSHVQLLEYNDAAVAFDEAFAIYATLGKDDKERPYRMMWYQTWPYWAYYYTGRYQDVINLANVTLKETISKPTLEESLYWRAVASLALGDKDSAVADLRQAVYLNKNFAIAQQELAKLGAKP